MKTPSFNSIVAVVGMASSILLPITHVAGQTAVATNPVGYLQMPCLSASDTLVAPSFTRPAAFTGSAAAISGNVVTFTSPGFTANQFVYAPAASPAVTDTFYLSVGPSTATLTGTLSVTSGSATVTGSGTTFGMDVKAGDRLTINDGYNLLTYTVTAIGSTTSLTLDRPYTDSAAGTTSAITPAKALTLKTTSLGKGTTAIGPTKIAPAATNTLSGLSATFDHSPYEGRFYQVTANSATSVTVNLNNDTLASVVAGTQVSIIPYWTLNTTFNTTPAALPGGENVSFTPTTSLFTPQTQILIPDYADSGTNLAATTIYYFINSGSNVGWRATGDNTTDHGNDPLLPDGYLTVRTPAGAPALPVTFAGAVPINKLVTTLTTQSSGPQDNAVALNRPAGATISTLGLSPSDGSFVATTSLFTPQDQLLVYDNTQAVINKSATAIYYYYNNAGNVGWRVTGDSTTDHGADSVAAGSALTVRKAPTTSGQTAIWSNSPNY